MTRLPLLGACRGRQDGLLYYCIPVSYFGTRVSRSKRPDTEQEPQYGVRRPRHHPHPASSRTQYARGDEPEPGNANRPHCGIQCEAPTPPLRLISSSPFQTETTEVTDNQQKNGASVSFSFVLSLVSCLKVRKVRTTKCRMGAAHKSASLVRFVSCLLNLLTSHTLRLVVRPEARHVPRGSCSGLCPVWAGAPKGA